MLKPWLAAMTCLVGFATAVHAEQFGMVVGIDEYLHFDPMPVPRGELSDLQGAVNDATAIADAMVASGINLTNSRFLIDADATLENFRAGWREMLEIAQPGDTLIVTFSGHGGREREISAPFDETTDQMDETIMFHEFDPENPRVGRLSDDQLHEMLVQASAFKVVWVMDSCHSAGLTREVNINHTGLSRSGGVWDIPVDPLEGEIIASDGDAGKDTLPHVTHILGTASEEQEVTETTIGGEQRGALSWFFSRAILGEADLDNNGHLTRFELTNYLQDRVMAQMNQTQSPRILPRGDHREVLSLIAPTIPGPPPAPAQPASVQIKVIGHLPPGLTPGSFSLVEVSPEITFEQDQTGWTVYNHTGDRVTHIVANADDILTRYKTLQILLSAKSSDISPLQIRTEHENAANPVGSIVGFTFFPPAPEIADLTLFNVASNGILQKLFPIRASDDKPVGGNGFSVRFQVTPPTGADQLVAVFCNRPPHDLRAYIDKFNAIIPEDLDHLDVALELGECQIDVIGLFTKGE